MKYTEKDIKKATIWYAGNKMLLVGIVKNDFLGSCTEYECYTYEGDMAYHWYRHSLMYSKEKTQ